MGSCLILGNALSEERSAVQARGFIGKGCWGGGQEGEGNGENCSATWLTVSDFIVIGLVSGLSLASHSELGSFLGPSVTPCRHLLASPGLRTRPGNVFVFSHI